MFSNRASAIVKILLVLLERTFVTLALSILRDSTDFATHLAYALIADTLIIVCILFVIDICVPWASRLRLARTVQLDVRYDDDANLV